MAQIHLHAESGDYAPVVLLPGDPNRATRIAARFDGGLEKCRLVNQHRGLLGYTGTINGVRTGLPESVAMTLVDIREAEAQLADRRKGMRSPEIDALAAQRRQAEAARCHLSDGVDLACRQEDERV